MRSETIVAVTRDERAPPVLERRKHQAALVAQVWDALSRRERELPGHFLADDGITAVRHRIEQLDVERLQESEAPLVGQCLAAFATAPAARSVIELLPSASANVMEIMQGHSVEAFIAVDAAAAPTEEAIARVRARNSSVTAARIVTDPVISLNTPRALPRPAFFACLGGTFSRFATIGAIRFLRAIRVAMSAHDRLILGVDLRSGASLEADHARERSLREALHRHALTVANRDCGADFDLERFRYYTRYDTEKKRLDIGLESVDASLVRVPSMKPVWLPAGSTIRTAVHCMYDRHALQAMLLGVGLIMDTWHEHQRGDHAVASASIVHGDARG